MVVANDGRYTGGNSCAYPSGICSIRTQLRSRGIHSQRLGGAHYPTRRGVCQFNFTADTSSPSNSTRVLTFTLYKNGVATPFRQSQSFSVSGEVLSVSFGAIQSNNAAANYDVYVQSTVNETFTFSEMVFLAQTLPANSPV